MMMTIASFMPGSGVENMHQNHRSTDGAS